MKKARTILAVFIPIMSLSKIIKKSCLTGALVLSLLPCFAKKAEAFPVIIGLEAIVTEVRDEDNLLFNRINIGNTVKGYYTFESTTPDTNAEDTIGDYWHYEGDYGFSLSVGGFNFRSDPYDNRFLVEIINNRVGKDNYLLRSYKNLPLYAGVPVGHICWQLDDFSGTALDNDSLPLTAPVLEDWSDSWYGLTMVYGECGMPSYYITCNVTSAQVIPEPATTLLLAFGGVFLRRRKRISNFECRMTK